MFKLIFEAWKSLNILLFFISLSSFLLLYIIISLYSSNSSKKEETDVIFSYIKPHDLQFLVFSDIMGKYSEKETKMKKKFLAFLLILFPIFSLGIAKAETIKIVSDTAYAPFEFKDSDQTYKGIDVDIINKVAEIKGWNIQMSYPGFDAGGKCGSSWSS